MKITTGYSELRMILKDIGIEFKDSGPAEDNLNKQVMIEIMNEQSNEAAISLFFDIDKDGNENFVCQE
jgi:hypothetical protein